MLGRDNIGALKPGYKADLALFKLDELRFSGAHDPLAALVNCGAYKADAVMINGDWKVRAGEWLGGDIAALMARHQQAAKTVFPYTTTLIRHMVSMTCAFWPTQRVAGCPCTWTPQPLKRSTHALAIVSKA